MKKPSERILEKYKSTAPKIWIGELIETQVERMFNAILEYLDEEEERNKLCEHLYESGYVCKKCGFSMIQPV